MLLSKSNVLSCDFPSFTSESIHQKHRSLPQFNPKFPTRQIPLAQVSKSLRPRTVFSICPLIHFSRTRGQFQVCRDSSEALQFWSRCWRTGKGNGDGGDHGNNWTTSILLFVLWVGLLFYVFRMAPDQTPYRDLYFIKKLMYLQGDDGYKMNEVLVAMWNIMGLWPLIYSMLLLPTGRSSKSKFPVWPFLLLSFLVVHMLLFRTLLFGSRHHQPLEKMKSGNGHLTY
ncbi:hypothetical protein HPP92_003030 [Vanilla planifolia]|uniref:Uncharacterized protein n=1 Tax=Vanilla planifolia TaxID=51239 RepID=A0A835VF24_VANPL|nr:hypothetical protein HPP92_003030 [Vanilla planifolia]